jgi:hypothetical protein
LRFLPIFGEKLLPAYIAETWEKNANIFGNNSISRSQFFNELGKDGAANPRFLIP